MRFGDHFHKSSVPIVINVNGSRYTQHYYSNLGIKSWKTRCTKMAATARMENARTVMLKCVPVKKVMRDVRSVGGHVPQVGLVVGQRAPVRQLAPRRPAATAQQHQPLHETGYSRNY